MAEDKNGFERTRLQGHEMVDQPNPCARSRFIATSSCGRWNVPCMVLDWRTMSAR
jgi:hypothetical protein